jgi:hypothetical protein
MLYALYWTAESKLFHATMPKCNYSMILLMESPTIIRVDLECRAARTSCCAGVHWKRMSTFWTTRAVSSSSDRPSPRPVPRGLDSFPTALGPAVQSPPLCWPPEATGLAQFRRFRRNESPSVGGSGTGYDELLRGANRLSTAAQTSAMLLYVRISEFIWRSIVPLAIRKLPLLRQNSAYSLWVGSTQTMGG